MKPKEQRMLKYMYTVILSFCLLLACTPVFSQKWDVGMQVGGAGYIGDLNPYKIYPTQHIKPTMGFFGSYHFKPEWSARLNFNYIPIEGSDSNSDEPQMQQRDLDFKNTIWELSSVLDFEFYEFRSSRSKTLYTPYIFAGAGVIYQDPKRIGSTISLIDQKIEVRNYKEIEAFLKNDSSQDDKEAPFPIAHAKYIPIIPIGAGFKVNLQGEWSVGLQVSYRFPLGGSRDFLDGVSKNYLPFIAVEKNQPLAKTDWEALANGSKVPYADLEGKMRGSNLKGADRYLTTVLTLSYSIYKWRDPSWK